MNRKRRKLLFLLALLLLLVGLPAWWLNREVQHERDNADLIAAIKRNDTTAALQALERGADANARDLGENKSSIGDAFRKMWNSLIGRKVAEEPANQPTAIVVYFARRQQPGGKVASPPENIALLKALLERGANPNDNDQEGNRILHRACYWGHPAPVRLLLQQGANAQAKGSNEQTPLHVSAGNSVESTRLLLEAGADPNAADANGDTPLHNAAAYSQLETARLLLAKGAKVHTKNTRDWTPLHLAALTENVEIVRLLLEHGADVNAKDTEGRTPLWLAQAKDSRALVRLLKQHGAK